MLYCLLRQEREKRRKQQEGDGTAVGREKEMTAICPFEVLQEESLIC